MTHSLVLTREDQEPERSVNVANTVRTLEEQLSRGDFFICASEKQRDLWLGFLAALGRINSRTYADERHTPAFHRRRVGLPTIRRSIPAPSWESVWGAGSDSVRSLNPHPGHRSRRRTRPRVRLYFLGMRHPKPDIVESGVATEARRLAEELGLTGTHVFFDEGWVAIPRAS